MNTHNSQVQTETPTESNQDRMLNRLNIQLEILQAQLSKSNHHFEPLVIVQLNTALYDMAIQAKQYAKDYNDPKFKDFSVVLENINVAVHRIWQVGELYQKLSSMVEEKNLIQKKEIEELRTKVINMDKFISKS